MPIDARCSYLVQAYDDILSDAERLKERLDPLREHRGHAIVDGWIEQINAGDKRGVTRALMQQHYDPAYDKSRRAIGASVLAHIEIAQLDSRGLLDAADRIVGVLDQL